MSDTRVPGEGPVPAVGMVVGESPGRIELAFGRPFVGPSGKMLDSALTKAGIQRSELYLTNAVKYLPEPKITPQDIAAGREELVAEVVRAQPRAILAVGASALKALTGKGRILEARGSEMKLHKSFGIEVPVIPTIHPAYIMRQQGLGGNERDSKGLLRYFEDDVFRFGRYLTGNFEEIPIVYVVNQPTSFAGKDVMFDVETSASRLCLVGLRPVGGPCYLYTSEAFALAYYAMRTARSLVAWQASYDLEYALTLGVAENDVPFEDPMFMVYLLDENAKQGLKDNAQKYLGVSAWEHGIRDRLRRGEPVSDEELLPYNAKDLTYMEHIWVRLRKEFADVALERVYREILLPATLVFMKMKQRGIYISSDRIEAAMKECESRRTAAREECHKVFGPDVNLNPSTSLRRALYAKLDLPVIEWTATGLESVDEYTLKRLRVHHPVIQQLLDYREWNKLREFVEKYHDLAATAPDSRVHPTYFLTFTVTGRTSSKEPNIQQLPRHPLVRSMVSAAPGNVLISADYSQLELRIAAEIAPEENMIQAMREGKDIHRMMAAMTTGKPEGEVTDDERTFAKNANFGFIYGADEETFIVQSLKNNDLNVSWDQAHIIREAFFRTWPGFGPWYANVYQILDRRESVRSLFGRVRRLPGIHAQDEYTRLAALREGINFCVQSTASDVTLLAAILIHRSGLPLVGYIHDAVLLEVPAGVAEAVAARVKEIMETAVLDHIRSIWGYTFRVPIRADVEISTVWGEKKLTRWLEKNNEIR